MGVSVFDKGKNKKSFIFCVICVICVSRHQKNDATDDNDDENKTFFQNDGADLFPIPPQSQKCFILRQFSAGLVPLGQSLARTLDCRKIPCLLRSCRP